MSLPRLNIEQERAKAAFTFAEQAKSKNGYDSYAKKVPMYILNNGLVNTLAFIHSKQKDAAWQQLNKDITSWFKDGDKDPQSLIRDKFVNNKSLIEVVVCLNDVELRQVTNETLALFSWLRRFVKEEA